MPESEIIQNILSGKTEYFEKLVKGCDSYLRKVGYYYLFKPEEVEDIIQTTYLKAFEHLDKFKGSSSFKSWLIRIMINECKQANRRLSLFRNYQSHFAISHTPLSYTCERDVIHSEVKSQLERAISRLKPIYKSVVTQRLLMGTSTQDTADRLGISEETVKIRLFRAKKKLRLDLLKESDMDQLYMDSKNYQPVYVGRN